MYGKDEVQDEKLSSKRFGLFMETDHIYVSWCSFASNVKGEWWINVDASIFNDRTVNYIVNSAPPKQKRIYLTEIQAFQVEDKIFVILSCYQKAVYICYVMCMFTRRKDNNSVVLLEKCAK